MKIGLNREHIYVLLPTGKRDEKDKRAWTGLNAFSRILAVYTQYSQLRQLAEIPVGRNSYNASSIVSSIEFDANEELFVTAGVSKRIRIFDFNSLLHHKVPGGGGGVGPKNIVKNNAFGPIS